MQVETIKQADLCSEVENFMLKLGYSEDSMGRYRKVWNELRAFSEGKELSLDICMEFLVKKYQINGISDSGKFSKKQMYILRSIRTLYDYRLFGTVFRRKKDVPEIEWPEEFQEQVTAYVNDLISKQVSNKYIRYLKWEIKNLILYLDKLGVKYLNEILPSYISGYISAQIGYSPYTIANKVSALRTFFDFLYLKGYLSYPLAESVPKARTRIRSKLPTVWSKEDIEKVLQTIDRGNSMGKRDYAIILLVARLGLRVGDVRSLKLSDLDWNAGEIRIIQSKTNTPLALPLLNDVAWAMIDYLKNGRPSFAKSQNLFIRHVSPYDAFGENDNLHYIITKYIVQARIPIEGKERTGLHSLRHSLATELMIQNVALPVISNILGHADPETTRQYLKVNVSALRQCALNVEVKADENN